MLDKGNTRGRIKVLEIILLPETIGNSSDEKYSIKNLIKIKQLKNKTAENKNLKQKSWLKNPFNHSKLIFPKRGLNAA